MTRAERLKAAQDERQKHLMAADDKLSVSAEGTMTDEDRKAVQASLDDADKCTATIEALAAEEQAEQALAARLAAARNQPLNPAIRAIVNQPDMPAAARGAAAQRWTIPAAARHHQKITAFVDDAAFTAEEKAYRFGMYALAKAANDIPQAYRFPQAQRFARDQNLYASGHVYATHLEGGSDTSGSHNFVPDEFGTDLIRLRETYGVARQLCKIQTMSSDTRTDPKWSSGLTAYFVGEGASGTTSDMQHSVVRLTAKKLMAISTYSSELAEDAVIDIGNTIAQEMAYAYSLKEDQCFIDGDGTSTYGGIIGLRPSFATLSIGTAPGFRDTTTSNTWAATVIADLTSLISVVPVYAQMGMRFLCSSQYYYQVMVPLLNAAGGVTGSELQDGFRTPRFQGIPVTFSQVMPTATATSSIAVMLGNFAMAATLGDRRRETLEFSKDATIDSVNLFTNDLLAIRATERIDINVHSFGSNTVAGPIVALSTGS